jgi:hypothetical protein
MHSNYIESAGKSSPSDYGSRDFLTASFIDFSGRRWFPREVKWVSSACVVSPMWFRGTKHRGPTTTGYSLGNILPGYVNRGARLAKPVSNSHYANFERYDSTFKMTRKQKLQLVKRLRGAYISMNSRLHLRMVVHVMELTNYKDLLPVLVQWSSISIRDLADPH